MTNKLVVIIKSLKVPKIKKMFIYEMKFLVPNYSCLQNPWLGGYRPHIPFSLSSVLNWIYWIPPSLTNKIPGYATAFHLHVMGSLVLRFRWWGFTGQWDKFPHFIPTYWLYYDSNFDVTMTERESIIRFPAVTVTWKPNLGVASSCRWCFKRSV